MITLKGKKMNREEFKRLKENMIVYDNAILNYDEHAQELEAVIFDNDERTQKILNYYGLQ